mmetsp:Transcript_5134/g.16318  ORF Transcript_5134/g.16318 Transcript_5134/m.16318 type:complete len:132 (-) Transcript_5134:84-479(-)
MNVQKKLFEQSPYLGSVKPIVSVRLKGASLLGDSVNKTCISSLRSADAGRLILVRGTVVRTGPVKLLECARVYQCTKCKFKFKIQADLDLQNPSISTPTVCRSTDAKTCKSNSFTCFEVTLLRFRKVPFGA